MKKFLVIGIYILFLSMISFSQTVDEIIAKNLDAKGGIEKITAIKSGKATGTIMNHGMEMPITMWYVKPDKIKMEMSFSNKKMIFAYDGKTAWQISPFRGSTDPQEITGDAAENMKENIENLNDPLVDYEKKGHKIEFTGKDDMEGTDVLKLNITLKSGKESTLFIDAETFIDLKAVSVKKSSDGQVMTIENVFGDYKPVAGVMMAHSINVTLNGQEGGSITIDSFEPNIQLPDDFFSIPSKTKTVEKKEEEKINE